MSFQFCTTPSNKFQLGSKRKKTTFITKRLIIFFGLSISNTSISSAPGDGKLTYDIIIYYNSRLRRYKSQICHVP